MAGLNGRVDPKNGKHTPEMTVREKAVSILPRNEVENIIQTGGFEMPTQIFQAGSLHAWAAQRKCDET